MNKLAKFLLISALILAIGAASGFAAEFELSTFKTSNSRNGEKFSVGYSTNYEMYYILESSPFNGDTNVYLDEVLLEKLRVNIDKALEWNQLAKENKTAVDKDLPDSTIRCHLRAVTTSFGASYTVSGYTYLRFHHKCDANGNYELKIYADTIDYSTQTNQTYPSFPFQTMKFKNGTLEEFRKAIDKDTLKAGIEKALHPETSKSSESGDDIFK